MKLWLLMPIVGIFCGAAVYADSFQTSPVSTTVIWNTTQYSPLTEYSVTTAGFPQGLLYNPSPFCNEPGQPACVVNVVSGPGCHNGSECGNFSYGSNLGADFNTAMEIWSYSATINPIKSPGNYSFLGNLYYWNPVEEVNLPVTGEIIVTTPGSASATPEPLSGELVAIGLIGLVVFRFRANSVDCARARRWVARP